MSNRNFLIILTVIIIIAFILLQPTMVSFLPYPSHESKVSAFLNQITKGDRIDGQKFWDKREQYFPGTFHFDKSGIDPQHSNDVMQKSKIALKEHKILVLAQYKSSVIVSDEIMIDAKEVPEVLNEIHKRQEGKNVFSKGGNYIVIEGNDKKIYLVFVISHDEMMRSNGFAAENKEISRDKSWLSVSEISSKN